MWFVKFIVTCFFIIIFITEKHCSNALRILGIFPLSIKSHFVVAEELMKVLAIRGHAVDVINQFPQKKPMPNYTDISLAGLTPTSVNNVTFEESQDKNSILIIRKVVDISGLKACNLLSN